MLTGGVFTGGGDKQPNLMAQRRQLPHPMVRAPALLHPYQTRRSPDEKAQNLSSPQGLSNLKYGDSDFR
jgi:hypothetical protein